MGKSKKIKKEIKEVTKIKSFSIFTNWYNRWKKELNEEQIKLTEEKRKKFFEGKPW
jgi:hypothetical protein